MRQASHVKSKAISGNAEKHRSYKAAWEQIRKAQDAGFYLEAIAIMESIISDRLLSYLVGIGEYHKDFSQQDLLKKGFKEFIDKWKKSVRKNAHLDSEEKKDILLLAKQLDSWRIDRNILLHQFAKSRPGEPTIEVHEFFDRGELAASTGEKLTRKVQAWHKRALAKHQKNAI